MDSEENTKSPSVHKPIDGRDRSGYQNGNIQASIQRSSLSPAAPFTVKGPLNSEHSEFLKDNSKLFYQKLREVHESCGLGLVASVAGAVLDLFMLYKEVTFRGGFAMVTKHSRWSEVASAVNFISKVSDPSFQLQQIYSSLLYQFELIYYFGIVEKRDAPPGMQSPALSSSLIGKTTNGSAPTLSSSLIGTTSNGSAPTLSSSLIGKATNGSAPTLSSSLIGTTSSGSTPTLSSSLIGKTSNFHPSGSTDCPTMKKKLQTNAYKSPTVMVGSEKHNGVIYNKDTAREQVTTSPSLMDGVGLKNTESDPVGMQVRVAPAKSEQAVGPPLEKGAKVKPTVGSSAKGTKKKDPEFPTRTRTAYHYFLCQECDRLKKIHGQSLGPDLRKRVIDLWKNLSETDRLPYIEESRKDKERFDREMVAYNERQNMQNGKRECKTHNPDQSVGVYNEHQNMQIDRGMIPNLESSTVGKGAYEECQTMETGKAQSKMHNPEPSVFIYKEHQNVQNCRVTGMKPNPDCTMVESVGYEGHQDMLIGKPQSEIHEPSRSGIHNLEPGKVDMVAYKEHQGEQVGFNHSRIHNPFPSEVERGAYRVSQNMHIGRGDLTTPYSEPSLCDESHVFVQTEESDNACGHDDYHVSLPIEELDKLRKPDQSMVEFAVELMENAEKLDASLQIQLGDFLSVP